MQHFSLVLGVLASLFGLLMIVLVGVVLAGHLRKAVADAAEQVARIWKAKAEANEIKAGTLERQVADFEDRFARLEQEAMLRDKRLEMMTRKSDYHDNVIRIIISVKASIPAEAMERIESLLQEMIAFCDKSEMDILSLKQSQLYFDKLRRRDSAIPKEENRNNN